MNSYHFKIGQKEHSKRHLILIDALGTKSVPLDPVHVYNLAKYVHRKVFDDMYHRHDNPIVNLISQVVCCGKYLSIQYLKRQRPPCRMLTMTETMRQ